LPYRKDTGSLRSSIAAARARAVVGDDAVATWWVTGVNQAAGTISLINPVGSQVRTYTVSTPADREQLPRVKASDKVTVVRRVGRLGHTEGVALVQRGSPQVGDYPDLSPLMQRDANSVRGYPDLRRSALR
jgi:hypothetical protein